MPTKRAAYSSGESESESYSDPDTHHHPRKQRARRPATRKIPSAVYLAKVISLAEQGRTPENASADIDANIIDRIKKCLDRAKHPSTPEAEAKAAMHIAARLMNQHNVSQAEILAHMPESERAGCAGQSTVSIRRADGDASKVVRLHAYQGDISWAMCTFFGCKFYSGTRRSRRGKQVELNFTFYGLADNTVAAAMAFEMCVNLVEKWCMRYTGAARKSYLHGVADELLKLAKKDVAAEEERAREADRAAREAQSKEEEAERRGQLDRLASLPPDDRTYAASVERDEEKDEVTQTNRDRGTNIERAQDDGDIRIKSEQEFSDWEGFSDDPDADGDGDGARDGDGWADGGNIKSEDESNDAESVQADFEEEEGRTLMDLTLDIDDEIDHLVKRGGSPRDEMQPKSAQTSEPVPSSPAPGQDTRDTGTDGPGEPLQEAQWLSEMQLVQFRAMAETIADDYLKEACIKLRHQPAKTRNITDFDTYRQGKADGRKIDVKRKRIES